MIEVTSTSRQEQCSLGSSFEELWRLLEEFDDEYDDDPFSASDELSFIPAVEGNNEVEPHFTENIT